MIPTLKRLGAAFAGAMLLLLAAACGGGSSSGSPGPGPQASNISGTAAVGAPLVGTVTVKDALGVVRGPAPIGVNGAYTADVTGMTPPFVFRAEGTANGENYIVHSIATAADANGTINITQLTDLVVANVAHQTARNYFDSFKDNHAGASKTAIDAEVKQLTEKLILVLNALGVNAAVDLLRTPFTPQKDALDKALDAIQVSVDDKTNIATLSTLVNNSTISYDLAQGPAAAAPLSADNVATGASDADLVKKALTDFSAKFANGLPLATDLTPLLTGGFLNDDVNGITFVNQASTMTQLVGGAFADITIHYIDYAATDKLGAIAPTARVSFSIKTRQGVELDRPQNWRLRKGADGIWRLHGNQRVLAIEGFVGMDQSIFGASQSCRRSGLNFNIEDINPGNDNGAIAYILVTGPGLPSSGVRYDNPAAGGKWKIRGTDLSHYAMADTCATGSQATSDAEIAAIPDHALYTLTAYTSADAKITFPSGTSDGTYGIKTQHRPMTLAELAASTDFPIITEPTLAQFAGYVSGDLKVAGSQLNPAKSAWVHLVQSTNLASAARDVEQDVIPGADGSASVNLSLPALGSGETVTSGRLSIEYPDAYRRNLWTGYFFPTP